MLIGLSNNKQLLEKINKGIKLFSEGAMEIEVLGRSKYLPKRVLKEAAQHYSNLLLSPRLNQEITTEVHLVKDLYKKLQIYGEVDAPYDYERRKYREFKIFLEANMGVRRMLCCLGHEMAHVMQYATGRLFEYDRNPARIKWNGQVMLEDEVDYWFSPWEIEARGLEEALYNSYLNRKQV